MLTDDKILDDPRRAVQLGLGFYSPLWPTFIAAAGAGVAFWAWAQWMRGKAENEFAPALAGTPIAVGVAPKPVSEPAVVPEPVAEAAPPANDVVATPSAPEPEVVPPVAEAVSGQIEDTLSVLAPVAPEQAPPAPESARRKRAASAPEPEPAPPAAATAARKPRVQAAVRQSPRKARAAKAAGDTNVSGPKRRRAPRRKG